MKAAFVLLAGRALATRCHGSGTWRSLAPIPIERQEHSTVAVSSSTLAVLGGIVPGNASVDTTGLVQLYDLRSNTWRTASPIPIPINHPNVAAVDGKIYVLGGLRVAPDFNWRAIPNSWVYDPATDKWNALPPLPAGHARGSAAVGVHGKTIYLAGGMTDLELTPPRTQASVAVVSAFDTKTSKWTTLPAAARNLPAARDHVGGAVVGREFFVIGGRDKGQTNVRDTVFVLDLGRLNAGWRTASGRMPTPRGGIAAAAVGTKVYTFGGEGNPAQGSDGVFNETEVYDTVSDSWKRLEPMQLPRHGTSAVAIGGRVYIPGGGVLMGAGPVSASDVFEPCGGR